MNFHKLSAPYNQMYLNHKTLSISTSEAPLSPFYWLSLSPPRITTSLFQYKSPACYFSFSVQRDILSYSLFCVQLLQHFVCEVLPYYFTWFKIVVLVLFYSVPLNKHTSFLYAFYLMLFLKNILKIYILNLKKTYII